VSTWTETIGIDFTINFLNALIEIDEPAMRALVETRVPCSMALADHRTVQVQAHDGAEPVVGVLGILNGLFGVDEEGWGPLTAVFENDGTLACFKRTPTATERKK
jgi:hypothetical protein